MSAEISTNELEKVVILLCCAITVVPIFRKIGLGSVLGYLVAGLIIGPFGFKWFVDPDSILHVAELGVVMFLFIIGLEMRPKHLWSLRRDIFGLGALQIAICIVALTVLGVLFGYSLAFSLIGAGGFVLTSTAIVMQFIAERGDLAQPRGQKIISILLFEDLLIVPFLALVAFAAPREVFVPDSSRTESIFIAFGTMTALVVVGIWLLRPFFRILAVVRSREVMTAAALVVVLGAALAMQVSGLSMAMGAFLAGVFLADSPFRHQIEADIEPFRGLLLGLFFMAVGMSLDLNVIYANINFVLLASASMMVLKGFCVYLVARFNKSSKKDAIDRATLMAQGGEFAFVLFTAGVAATLITQNEAALLTAIVILSMVFTPLVVIAIKRFAPIVKQSMDGVELANGLSGKILVIGFGRFGQIISQFLLLKTVDVTIIDSDVEIIKSVKNFGFKVYYGDGSRLDVLRASGAETAQAIAICIDNEEKTNHIVDLIKSEFPQAKVLVRTYDRTHAREIVTKGVDYQVRETFESAMRFGEASLSFLGVSPAEAAQAAEKVRKLDHDRFELELAAGSTDGGRELLLGNVTKPEPLVEPHSSSETLNPSNENEEYENHSPL